MSEGYNPHPRLSIPAPLGVGLSGTNEVLDFELDGWVRPREARRRLAEQLPQGISLRSVQCLPARPSRRVAQLSYRVPLLPGHPLSEERLEQLVGAPRLFVERISDGKRKGVDVASFLRDARLEGEQLLLLVEVNERGTARVEEVLEALGLVPGLHYRKGTIERTHVNLSSSP